MLQHVLIGDLAPLCLVIGMTGPVLRPVLALRPVERLRVLTHPFVALPLWALDLYVWHIPYLYEAALHNTVVHAVEHASFFTFGALMWAPVLETLPAPVWFGTGWKLGYIVIVRMIETAQASKAPIQRLADQVQRNVRDRDILFQNILFDGDRLCGFLDWELARISYPAADLGYMRTAVCRVMPSRAELSSASALLVAAGRIPNSDQLRVEAGGIATDERGNVRKSSMGPTREPKEAMASRRPAAGEGSGSTASPDDTLPCASTTS